MEKALPRLIFFQLHLTIIDNKTIYQNTSFKQIIIYSNYKYNSRIQFYHNQLYSREKNCGSQELRCHEYF